jgi:hypothetical protein
MAKQHQKKQETKKTIKQNKNTNDKTQLFATTPPLGVCNLIFLFFFLLFDFLVSS